MIKSMKMMTMVLGLSIAGSAFTCSENGKGGFLPENDLYISANQKSVNGISEEEFNKAIDEVEQIYAPIVASMGGKLNIERNWTDGTVNAYASQSGSTWKVAMFGGLARHETITKDAMALVVCHEIGHHIGGAPKKVGYYSNSWASNEGQSDYFANLKCLRRAFLNDDNKAIISKMEIPMALSEACSKAFASEEDRAICIRGGMAGDSVARLFAALRNQSTPAKFDTPDRTVVSVTNDNHPATQCRMDTYFQGSLCDVSINEDVEQDSEVSGTCHGSLGHDSGLRPRCWFKPSVQ